MSTNSLVIKVGIFTEWFQPHLIPSVFTTILTLTRLWTDPVDGSCTSQLSWTFRICLISLLCKSASQPAAVEG
jgi:hypothetical protein